MKNLTVSTKFKKQPMVSVVMPVYNAEKYLSAALDSVLSQNYENMEIICIDDRSTDGSLAILKTYQKEFPNKIKLIRNSKNRGVAEASNKGFEIAKGDFIARFDADDIMLPNRIKKQVAFLLTNTDVVAVGGQVEIVDVKANYIGMKNFPETSNEVDKMMFTLMPIQQGGAMFNKTKLPKNFGWYPKNQNTAEEVDLFFRLRKYGKIQNLPVVVIKYRQYQTSTSLIDPKKTFYLTLKARIKAVVKYGYKPSLAAILTNILQTVLITLLPTNMIYPLFAFYRGFMKINISGSFKPALKLEFEVK